MALQVADMCISRAFMHCYTEAVRACMHAAHALTLRSLPAAHHTGLQGGLNAELRQRSVRDLVARDTPGYAIGGLAGGEDKDSFWRVVAACAPALPAGKPRYVMGIGYPVDVVVCTALGADMYDSVFPTRTARFGVALVDGPNGDLRLKKKMYEGALAGQLQCCLFVRQIRSCRGQGHALFWPGCIGACSRVSTHIQAQLASRYHCTAYASHPALAAVENEHPAIAAIVNGSVNGLVNFCNCCPLSVDQHHRLHLQMTRGQLPRTAPAPHASTTAGLPCMLPSS